MKLNWDKIIFATSILGMAGSAFGIIGGLIFKSAIVALIGLGIWAIALIIIVSKTMHNYLFNNPL